MGMTDKQFASYQKSQLRRMEQVQENLKKQGIKDPVLDQMIKDLQEELSRP